LLQFRLDRAQSRAYQLLQPGRVITLPWGRGSGKTFLGRAGIHTRAFEHPGCHIGILMPSLKQAKRVYWKSLFVDFHGGLKSYVKSVNRTELVAEYRNGSTLTTWGVENYDAIRGQRFDYLFEDETDDISPEVEQSVVEPTFSRSGSRSIWFKTGTPKKGRHGALYKSFARIGDGRHYGFRMPSSESPQVDQEWLARIKVDPATNPRVFKREYECNFDATSGLVYGDVYDETFHVRPWDDNREPSEWIVGGDFGFEHPNAFLRIAVTGAGGDTVAHVVEERVKTKQVDQDMVDDAIEWRDLPGMARAPWYCDHARPEKIQALRNAGINAKPANKSVEEGIDTVADALFIRDRVRGGVLTGERFAKLYVDPRCKHTIAGLTKYKRREDPHREGEFLDEVVKADDDEMDALRYGLHTHFSSSRSRRTDTY